MRQIQRCDFAKQWLYRNSGQEIYIGDKRILDFQGDAYKIDYKDPLKTSIIIKQRQDPIKPPIYKKISYEDLRKINYKIIVRRVNPTNQAFAGQKKTYAIVPMEVFGKEMNPEGHDIIIDIANKRLALQGRNVKIPTWTYIEKKPIFRVPPQRVLDPMVDYRKIEMQRWIKLGKQMGQIPEKTYKKLEIRNDIPLLISEEGYLVCLPFEREEPTVGVQGMKGMGKTLFLHALADRAFWKFRKKVAILNDRNNECYTWCMPWDKTGEQYIKSKFLEILKQIGEDTLPLPCVYLYPNTHDLRYLNYEDRVGFRISLAFQEVIKNYRYFFTGNEEFQMGASLKYFKNLMPQIMECKSEQEVLDKIEMDMPEGFEKVGVKINNILQELFDQKILDVSTNINSKWKMKNTKTGVEKEYNPIITSLLCDLVPVVVTSNLYNKDYYPQYFRYLVEDIFKKQIEDQFFIKNNVCVWAFCDEITELDQKNKQTVASGILQRMVAEGRPNRLGLVWATQNPDKISDRIFTNTNYSITFRHKTSEQANAVVAGFDLIKKRKEDILNLRKFQALACTTEKFAVYDQEGKRSMTDENFLGTIVPSLSWHKPPKITDS